MLMTILLFLVPSIELLLYQEIKLLYPFDILSKSVWKRKIIPLTIKKRVTPKIEKHLPVLWSLFRQKNPGGVSDLTQFFKELQTFPKCW